MIRIRYFGRRVAVAALGLLLPLAAPAQDVTLNLKDADITALINTVAEVTGRNFVVDPRVKGKVTVISSQPMDHSELYEVFLSILDVHGFAAIPAGQVTSIVPTASAKTVGGEVPEAAAGDFITEVIPVSNVSANQLVAILRPLIPQFGHLGAHPDSNILVISDRAANVARIKRLVARIDLPGGRDAEVVVLQNASAPELVQILQSLQGGEAAAMARMVADLRTNSILLSGPLSERVRLRALIAHLDTPLESTGNTHVLYLRYADAEQIAPLLESVIAPDPEKRQAGETRIQPDPATNSLVVTAPPDVMTTLRAVLRQLDIRRAQVHVEGVIAEVSDDQARELGVQWIVDGRGDGSGPISATSFGGVGSNIVDITRGVIEDGFPVVGSGTTLAVGRFDSDRTSFAGLLRALQADSKTNILSTPSLTTLDNEEAEIVVGQSVPFITGQFTNTGTSESAVNPFQTIEREDVGIQLRVRPQINEGDVMRLEIEQEVSSIAQQTGGGGIVAADLITSKRFIRTTVLVEDRQVVVLGGLIDDQTTEVEERVPLFGSLPVIGRLFRYRVSDQGKVNLMVFLRPIIVRDATVSAQVTGDKYNAIRNQQLRDRLAAADNKTSAIPPVLAPIEEYVSGEGSAVTQGNARVR
ncbi:MAG: type II secretion system secretin GspD [Pseudomonadota bacterium]|nr:type II secretion system secretin GspD [Pseudomonadota bacterium]